MSLISHAFVGIESGTPNAAANPLKPQQQKHGLSFTESPSTPETTVAPLCFSSPEQEDLFLTPLKQVSIPDSPLCADDVIGNITAKSRVSSSTPLNATRTSKNSRANSASEFSPSFAISENSQFSLHTSNFLPTFIRPFPTSPTRFTSKSPKFVGPLPIPDFAHQLSEVRKSSLSPPGSNGALGFSGKRTAYTASGKPRKRIRKFEIATPLRSRRLLREESINFHRVVGKGSFCEVFCVSIKRIETRSKKRLYALKRTLPICSVFSRRGVLKEYETYKLLDKHKNVLHYISAWEENDICYALCDFCENGSLDKKLHTETTNFTEDEIKRIIVDIASGLAHIHSKGFAHYDIKPANLLIDSLNRIVIGDLGQAFKLSDSSGSEGDGLYMAPEVLEGHHSFAADMYSFGMTLYEIITNYVIERGPFLDDLRSGKITFNPKKSVSKELEQLVIHLLSSNPNERPSAKDVLEMDFLKSFAKKKQ